jgi:uncharacterized protein (TIGR02271 family)
MVRTTRPDPRASSNVRHAPLGRRSEEQQTLELREEELVPHTELRDLGDVIVRTRIEETPGRLEVDAYREEVEIEHEPVGQAVTNRQEPWQEGGTLVVPVYEEQLVVSKRLVLKERLRIRRVATTERQLFEETLRREQLVVEDPQATGLVHERYPTEHATETSNQVQATDDGAQSGLLQNIVRKALE